jgi:hypothetical protein
VKNTGTTNGRRFIMMYKAYQPGHPDVVIAEGNDKEMVINDAQTQFPMDNIIITTTTPDGRVSGSFTNPLSGMGF